MSLRGDDLLPVHATAPAPIEPRLRIVRCDCGAILLKCRGGTDCADDPFQMELYCKRCKGRPPLRVVKGAVYDALGQRRDTSEAPR